MLSKKMFFFIFIAMFKATSNDISFNKINRDENTTVEDNDIIDDNNMDILDRFLNEENLEDFSDEYFDNESLCSFSELLNNINQTTVRHPTKIQYGTFKNQRNISSYSTNNSAPYGTNNIKGESKINRVCDSSKNIIRKPNPFKKTFIEKISILNENNPCKMQIYRNIIERVIRILNNIIDFYRISTIKKIEVNNINNIENVHSLNNQIEQTIIQLREQIPKHPLEINEAIKMLDYKLEIMTGEFYGVINERKDKIYNPMCNITNILKNSFITIYHRDLIILLFKELISNKENLVELNSIFLQSMNNYIDNFCFNSATDDLFLLKIIFVLKTVNKKTKSEKPTSFIKKMNETIEKCVIYNLWKFNSLSTRNVLNKIKNILLALAPEKQDKIPFKNNDFYFLASIIKIKTWLIYKYILPLCNNSFDFEDCNGTNNLIVFNQLKAMECLNQLKNLTFQRTIFKQK